MKIGLDSLKGVELELEKFKSDYNEKSKSFDLMAEEFEIYMKEKPVWRKS